MNSLIFYIVIVFVAVLLFLIFWGAKQLVTNLYPKDEGEITLEDNNGNAIISYIVEKDEESEVKLGVETTDKP